MAKQIPVPQTGASLNAAAVNREAIGRDPRPARQAGPAVHESREALEAEIHHLERRIRDRRGLIFFVVITIVLGLIYGLLQFFALREVRDYLDKRYPGQSFKVSLARPSLLPLGFVTPVRDLSSSGRVDFVVRIFGGLEHERGSNQIRQRSAASSWELFYDDDYLYQRSSRQTRAFINSTIDSEQGRNAIESIDLAENQSNASRWQDIQVGTGSEQNLMLEIRFKPSISSLQDFANLSANIWDSLRNQLAEQSIQSVAFISAKMPSDDGVFAALGQERKRQIPAKKSEQPSGSESSAEGEVQAETSQAPARYRYFRYSLVLNENSFEINDAAIFNGIRILESN
ncbi:MAG: hypothetical protein Q4P72_01870 [Eubacteriales bacterium]|nr:hypothetical protein [Eubacteriales bacterium]